MSGASPVAVPRVQSLRHEEAGWFRRQRAGSQAWNGAPAFCLECFAGTARLSDVLHDRGLNSCLQTSAMVQDVTAHSTNHPSLAPTGPPLGHLSQRHGLGLEPGQGWHQ